MYSPSAAAILTRGGREGREEMETIYAAACCCYMTVLHIVNGEVIHILSSGCTSLTAAVTKGRVTRVSEWQAGMWENQEILFFKKKISLKWKMWCEGKKEPDSRFFFMAKYTFCLLNDSSDVLIQLNTRKFHYATMMGIFIVKGNDSWYVLMMLKMLSDKSDLVILLYICRLLTV